MPIVGYISTVLYGGRLKYFPYVGGSWFLSFISPPCSTKCPLFSLDVVTFLACLSLYPIFKNSNVSSYFSALFFPLCSFFFTPLHLLIFYTFIASNYEALTINRQLKALNYIYEVNGQHSVRASKHKYLGVTVDHHLDWKDHVLNFINASARSTLGILGRNISSCPVEVRPEPTPSICSTKCRVHLGTFESEYWWAGESTWVSATSSCPVRT